MVENVTDATADPAESGRIAAFFDLDKTVIAKSSVLAFTRPFFEHGLLNRRAVLASSYAQLLFVLSTVDQERVDRMREHIAQMCKGWDVEQIRSIVNETLDEIVTPLVYAEAKDLIADHRARGHDVVIVSASGEEVVTPIAQALGASYSAASRMRIVDGRYAGELEFYCFGEAKSTAMRELAAEHGYDLTRSYAYSDSATDVPMLQAVGKPRAVNPDRALRRCANENQWLILTFTRPVPLSRRVRPSAKGLIRLAAAGASAALITGAAVYLAGRRHDPRRHPRLLPLPS
ncbi:MULTISPECIES: HAD-IB family hydrolase [unclassified Rhodococcus (in: high G+C Gram-positive bacteria)]|uniref:HAD-IB family hydrolase n=1 Tax=Rhodococcus sp. SJ-3 TaxID=3454628 RepID=UPI002DAE3A2B|nr:HAD-IB family hydrolase [Rhodococcus sp. (in: high G+C Gram-positive bacteria)]